MGGGRGEERNARRAPHARSGAGWRRDDVIGNGGLWRGGDVRGLEDLRPASCIVFTEREKETITASSNLYHLREVLLLRFLVESSISTAWNLSPPSHKHTRYPPIFPAKRFHWPISKS